MDNCAPGLHRAVRLNELDKMRKLIAGGYAIQSCDALGRTALHWATVLGHEEALKVLLLNTTRRMIDAKDKHGRTCLHYACSAGNVQFASLMIKRGASAKSVDCRGRTPLHYAVQSMSPEVVDLLIENGADKNVGDCDGVASWDMALRLGCSHLFGALKSHHAVRVENNEETEQSQAKKHHIKNAGNDYLQAKKHHPIKNEGLQGKQYGSLDALLADWKCAEAKKKEEPHDPVKEALNVWREAEAVARQERKMHSPNSCEDGNDTFCQSSSSVLQLQKDVNWFLQNSDLGMFYLSRNGVEKMDGGWGCTEWDSPLKPQDRMEWRSSSRLQKEKPFMDHPWLCVNEHCPGSPIEAV